MPTKIEKGFDPRGLPDRLPAPIEIAFVNNMPDAAFFATEAQFRGMLEAGAGELPFHMRLYLLPGVERNDILKQQLHHRYEDVEALYREAPRPLW